MLKRIQCDFNSINENGRVHLTTRGALACIEKTPIKVSEKIIISDDELEVEAIVEKDQYGDFVALPIWSTMVEI